MLAPRVNVRDIALLPLVQGAVAFLGEQIGKAEDRVQRSSQFMTHRREELVLELACALNLFLSFYHRVRELFHFLFGSFQLRSTFLNALFELVVSLTQCAFALLRL